MREARRAYNEARRALDPDYARRYEARYKHKGKRSLTVEGITPHEGPVKTGRYTDLNSLIAAAISQEGKKVAGEIFMDFPPISDAAADRVQEKTGVDIHGLGHAIDGDGIRHSIDMHGEGGRRLRHFQNQTPLTLQDFELLPYVVENAEDVKNGDVEGSIVFRKRVNGYIIAVEAINKTHNKLMPVTAWKEKVPGNGMPSPGPAASPRTSETRPAPSGTVSAAPYDNFTSLGEDVKGDRHEQVGDTLKVMDVEGPAAEAESYGQVSIPQNFTVEAQRAALRRGLTSNPAFNTRLDITWTRSQIESIDDSLLLRIAMTPQERANAGLARYDLMDYDENEPATWPEGPRKTEALLLERRLRNEDPEFIEEFEANRRQRGIEEEDAYILDTWRDGPDKAEALALKKQIAEDEARYDAIDDDAELDALREKIEAAEERLSALTEAKEQEIEAREAAEEEAEEEAWEAALAEVEERLGALLDEENAEAEAEGEVAARLTELYSERLAAFSESLDAELWVLNDLDVDSIAEAQALLEEAESTPPAQWRPELRAFMERWRESDVFLGRDAEEYARYHLGANMDEALDNPLMWQGVTELSELYYDLTEAELGIALGGDPEDIADFERRKEDALAAAREALETMNDEVDALRAEEDARNEALNATLDELEEAEEEDAESYEQRGAGGETDTRITRDDVTAVQAIPGKSVNDFTSEEIQSTAKWARKFWNELKTKSPFFRAMFGDWRANDRTPVVVVKLNKSADNMPTQTSFKNKDTDWDIEVQKFLRSETDNKTNKNKRQRSKRGTPAAKEESIAYKALGNIQELLEGGILLDTRSPKENNNKTTTTFMHSLYSVLEVTDDTGKTREHLIKILVEELYDGNREGTIRRAYQLKEIKVISPSGADPIYHDAKAHGISKDAHPDRLNIKTVADLFQFVKANDRTFNPKEASKVVDANGEPLVVWHGSPKSGFEVFNTEGNGKTEGTGAFFTSLSKTASTYSGSSQTMETYVDENGDIRSESGAYNYPVYLYIRNPYVFDAQGRNWDSLGDICIYNEETGEEIFEKQDGTPFKNIDDAWDYVEAGLGDEEHQKYNVFGSDMSTDDIVREVKRGEYGDGYDGVIFENIADEGPHGQGYGWESDVYVVFSPEQIKSATDNAGTFDASDPDIYRQSIGKKGAAALDAHDAGRRIDNLGVAREMEKAGKDAKTILLATSWQRWADGEWRFDTDDSGTRVSLDGDIVLEKRDPDYARMKEFDRKATREELTEEEDAEYERLDKKYRKTVVHKIERLQQGKPVFLPDLFDAPELFTAYPQLQSIRVFFAPINGAGNYNRSSREITLNIEMLRNQQEQKARSTLHHEVQHVIQDIEGFAPGGNPEQFGSGDVDVGRYTRRQKQAKADEMFNALTPEQQERFRDVMHETQTTRRRDIPALLEKLLPEEERQLFMQWHEAVEAAESAASGWEKVPPHEAYRRLSGEVEARNSSTRMDMTAEERRNTLLAETEDVAREDQIILRDALGVSESREAAPTPEQTAQIERGMAAMERVLTEHVDVMDAMHRDDLGGIAFIWGTKGAGIAHILRDHIPVGIDAQDFMRTLIDVIATGELGEEYPIQNGRKQRVNITKGPYTVVLGKEYDDQKVNWVVTGWDARVPDRRKLRSGTPDKGQDFSGATLSEATSSATEREQNRASRKSIPQGGGDVNAETSWARGKRVWEASSFVEFFKTANASSGFHEMAHHMFRVMMDLSEMEGVNQGIIDDVDTVLRNAGISREQWKTDREARRVAHEYFARSFEVYLSEGKAPNKELAGVFKRVRQWFIEVYHDVVQALGIELNDEMRDVFDRLLATPEEIDARTQIKALALEEATAREEIRRAEAQLREAEAQRQDSAEWDFPELSENAAEAVDGWLAQMEEYELGRKAREAVREIANVIRANGGLRFEDMVHELGEALARDVRQKWPGLFRNMTRNGQLSLDVLAEQLQANGINLDVGGLIQWLQETANETPPRPAPLAEVNADTLNALIDRLGIDGAREYLTVRTRDLTRLQKQLQAAYEADKNNGDVRAALEGTYKEQREIAESVKALGRVRNAPDLDRELTEAERMGLPEGVSDAAEPEVHEKKRPTQEQTMTLYEAMRRGYEMAEKYTREAYRAGRREGQESAGEQARARIDKLKKRIEMLSKVKPEMAKLLKGIRRMAQHEDISWAAQQRIKELLEGYDLRKRTKETLLRRAELGAYLNEHPEEQGRNAEEKYLLTTTIGEMTLDDLRDLHRQVKELHDQGAREFHMWEAERRERIDKIHGSLRGSLEKRKVKAPIATLGPEDKGKQYKGLRGKLAKVGDWIYAATLGRDRFFDWLDGGRTKYGGAFVRHFVDDLNACRDKGLSHVFERRLWMEEELRKLGFKLRDFSRVATEIDGRSYTWDRIMEIYLGMRNEKKARAILYGCFVNEGSYTPEQAQGVINQLIGMLDERHRAAAELESLINSPEALREAAEEALRGRERSDWLALEAALFGEQARKDRERIAGEERKEEERRERKERRGREKAENRA